jgi:hypothetical protein
LALLAVASWTCWAQLLDFQHGLWASVRGLLTSGALMVGATVLGLYATIHAMSGFVSACCAYQGPYRKELARRWGQADLSGYVKEAEAQMADAGAPDWILLLQSHTPGERVVLWVRVELSAGRAHVQSCLAPLAEDVLIGHCPELARPHVRSLEPHEEGLLRVFLETMAGEGEVELPAEPDGVVECELVCLDRKRGSKLHLHQVLAERSPAPLPDPQALLLWTVFQLDAERLANEAPGGPDATGGRESEALEWPARYRIQDGLRAEFAPRPARPRRRPTRKRAGLITSLTEVRADFAGGTGRDVPRLGAVDELGERDGGAPEKPAAKTREGGKRHRPRRRHGPAELPDA